MTNRKEGNKGQKRAETRSAPSPQGPNKETGEGQPKEEKSAKTQSPPTLPSRGCTRQERTEARQAAHNTATARKRDSSSSGKGEQAGEKRAETRSPPKLPNSGSPRQERAETRQAARNTAAASRPREHETIGHPDTRSKTSNAYEQNK
jgi:hypothetical protein